MSDSALVLAMETIPDLRISSAHDWLYRMMDGEIKDKSTGSLPCVTALYYSNGDPTMMLVG